MKSLKNSADVDKKSSARLALNGSFNAVNFGIPTYLAGERDKMQVKKSAKLEGVK
ncbi:MAG: hypothetical protein LBP51_07995 [Deferribacteraceae bacterium]|jgi:hypothetical protein|nr:hypothetical protein [Deferribacteraceae bacterium]